MRRFVAVLLMVPIPVAAQQRVRTFDKPQFEYSEGFTMLSSLHELPDGRVVVSDIRERTLQVIDLRTNRAAPVGRAGAGPQEWGTPFRLLAYVGDSMLVVDVGNRRFLLVDPTGKPVRTINPAAEQASSGMNRSAASAGPQLLSVGSYLVAGVRATDRQGRLYATGLSVVMTDGGPRTLDSVPIIRQTVLATNPDTMAWVQLPATAASGAPTGMAGGAGQIAMVGRPQPYAVGDEWNVTPEGVIVIARARDYRIDVVLPDKRVIRGSPVAFTPVRITEADKEAWRRAAARPIVLGGPPNAAPMPAVPASEPSSWPETKPPFMSAGVRVAPNGEVWVLRSRASSDLVATFDVFNQQGRQTGQVKLPPRSSLLGFGAKGVYLSRMDDDDLLYVQFHPVAW